MNSAFEIWLCQCIKECCGHFLAMFLTLDPVLDIVLFQVCTSGPSALAFRFDPAVLLRKRPAPTFPETPHGVYLVMGRASDRLELVFRVC